MSEFVDAQAREQYLVAYEAMLRGWPEYERLEVTGRYGRTVALATGSPDAPVLVLLHGRYTPSATWAPIITELANRYRICAIDTICEPGLSSNDGAPLRKRSHYTIWLRETWDALGIEAAHLCGHSFGGWLAARFATEHPGRVSSLTLLDPAQVFAPFTATWLLRCIPPFLAPTTRNISSLFRWLGKERPAQRDLVDLATKGMLTFRLRAPEATRLSAPELRRLSMPTQQLIAEQTVVHNPARALRTAERLNPIVKSTLVPDCSHFIVNDQPSQVLNALDALIE